ncbi:MAG: M42 family metallopeptidase [Clostridiales bacterium]|nr:M42 family metallopeptidase [Clostridiales bacterium]
MEARNLLKAYCMIPAISGYEGELAYSFLEDIKPFCDETTIDRAGNVIGKIEGNDLSAPTIMIFAHLDSLGFIVRRVEKDGFLQIDRLGGIPEKVLPGCRLKIRSEYGSWHSGVIGPKAHHATPAEEKYKVDLVTSLYVDIGASSDEEVRTLGIEVGCPAVYEPMYTELTGGKVSATFVDDRGGVAALVLIAENLSKSRPEATVYVVGTVWEEFNLRGAMMAARTVKPDIALSIDVMLTGDTPDLRNKFQINIGDGPAVGLYSFHGRGTLNGTLPHEGLFKLAKTAAANAGVPLQRFAGLGILTDMAYLQLEGEGAACLELGFPARYTHSPVEVCDPSDIDKLAILASEMARLVDIDFELDRY